MAKRSSHKESVLKRNAFLVVGGLTTLYFLYTLNKNKMDTNPQKKTSKKKQGTMDKVIFGLLIGGAIGSVLGLTVAPEKGKKVRKGLKKTGKKISEKIEEHEDAVAVVTNKSKGLLSFVTSKILGAKEEHEEGSILDWIADMDVIPNEAEEEISQ